ncbi:type IV conjugative transfer system protein TraL [Ferrimonas kyonanensis]|uniref:type IV conjugative transfer system protein TraL n=1 Tax=Ferrimonas kyonanensis TaxID=364763 RepID=UPI000406ABAF|nr:type IV conjugative transfer system protein TraL [Ferrimonas kyonanensis]
MKAYRTKLKINDPLIALFVFTEDQIIPVGIAIGIGLLTETSLQLLMVALIYIYITEKIKKRYPPGFIRQRLWSLGLLPEQPRPSKPDPFVSRFYG